MARSDYGPSCTGFKAQRNSCNRPRGTWETKTLNITREVYTQYVYEKLLPDTIRQFPRDRDSRCQNVYIQQDNPNTHINPNCPTWLEMSQRDARFKFHFKKQPANSPDTNILDLGFFRALQSSQWQLPPARTIDELIDQVQEAWRLYDPVQLDEIWLSHQGVCNSILESEGDNNFPLPHLEKGKQSRNGQLPTQLELSKGALTAHRSLQCLNLVFAINLTLFFMMTQ